MLSMKTLLLSLALLLALSVTVRAEETFEEFEFEHTDHEAYMPKDGVFAHHENVDLTEIMEELEGDSQKRAVQSTACSSSLTGLCITRTLNGNNYEWRAAYSGSGPNSIVVGMRFSSVESGYGAKSTASTGKLWRDPSGRLASYNQLNKSQSVLLIRMERTANTKTIPGYSFFFYTRVTSLCSQGLCSKVVRHRHGKLINFYAVNAVYAEYTHKWAFSNNANVAMKYAKSTTNYNGQSLVAPRRLPGKGKSQRLMVQGKVKDIGAYAGFSYSFYVRQGSFKAAYDIAKKHQLPFAGKVGCGQGNGGSFSHSNIWSQYAVDLGIANGGKIYSARDGVAFKVVESNKYSKFDTNICPNGPNNCNVAGSDPNLLYMRIDGGLISVYAHMKQGGVVPKVGQVIKGKKVVGYCGTTGFSTGPHLHYVVYKTLPFGHSSGSAYKSMKIKYLDKNGNTVIPETGKYYVGSSGLNKRSVEEIEAAAAECEVSEWSELTECDVVCGGGVALRTRDILNDPEDISSCPPLEEKVPCNTQACDVDCDVSEFEDWTECSEECGGAGTFTLTRVVEAEPTGNGYACPALQVTRVCNEQPCDTACPVAWSAWSECSASCGVGIRTRSREDPEAATAAGCVGATTMEENCNVHACEHEVETPVEETPLTDECVWEDWSDWSVCDTCVTSRFRNAHSDTGYMCPEAQEEEADCECASLGGDGEDTISVTDDDRQTMKGASGSFPTWALATMAGVAFALIVAGVVIVVLRRKGNSDEPSAYNLM